MKNVVGMGGHVVCLGVRECLCVRVCVLADVRCEGVSHPLDSGVGREAGSPSFLRASGLSEGPQKRA